MEYAQEQCSFTMLTASKCPDILDNIAISRNQQIPISARLTFNREGGPRCGFSDRHPKFSS